LHLPDPKRDDRFPGAANPLPELLRTPSGLAIVEIQGTLNMPSLDSLQDDEQDSSSTTTTCPTGEARQLEVDIGRLVFPDYTPDCAPTGGGDLRWAKRVYLYVGSHQRLTGEVKKLPNPLAVVVKRKHNNNAPPMGCQRRQEEDEQEGVGRNGSDDGTADDELEIVELVRWKILFSQRPEPVGE
jgi:chromosome transmission fidelity protein 8